MWKKAENYLKKDKYIGPVIGLYGPCKIAPGATKNYFVDLVDAICGQQLSIKAAATIYGRVKNGLGGVITPTKILKTSEAKFRSWGLSRQKTSYLKDLAERVQKKEVKIKTLNRLSDDEVLRELIAVKGIGRWTAEMFLMFTLARADVFPVDDLGIKKGVEKLLGKQLSDQKVAEFALRWKPYRTVAAWYIWQSLDVKT
jgi:DNA-3-methyladenine glycosylase II